jgi:hypothetical protein
MSEEEVTQQEVCKDVDQHPLGAVQVENVEPAVEEQLKHQEEQPLRFSLSRTKKLLGHIMAHPCIPPRQATPETVVISDSSAGAASDLSNDNRCVLSRPSDLR